MLSSHLPAVLTGMVQVGVGDFFAQASASGFVGQAAYNNRASPAVRISPAISLGPTLRHGRRLAAQVREQEHQLRAAR